ncbi:MAG: hypothetical protein ABIN67_06870 [Ferruginibacter sp.]
MKRNFIVLIFILVAFTTAFFLWTARSAKKKSDDLMSKFKEIDRGIGTSKDSAHNSKGIVAVEEFYPISVLKSETILLIDSLKENYENIVEPSKSIAISKYLRPDFKRLLNNIQQINKLKWDLVDSKTPDTVAYWTRSDKFSEKKWLITFESSSKEEIFIYLNYLRSEILTYH